MLFNVPTLGFGSKPSFIAIVKGKRSSELMSQILTMAVQNLNEADRDDMVRYMKQAMVGTFFERWLQMGGWIGMETSGEMNDGGGKMPKRSKTEEPAAAAESQPTTHESGDEKLSSECKISTEQIPAAATMPVQQTNSTDVSTCSCCCTTTKKTIDSAEKPTSAAELEKLIRAIGTNPNMNSQQKNLTIQGLRDSVWKSNCRVSKRKREEGAQNTTQALATAATSGVTRSESARQPHQTHHLR